MKYWLIIFLLVTPVLTVPIPVKASCVCYTVDNKASELPDSEAMDDEACSRECIASGFESGKEASEETSADLTSQALEKAQEVIDSGACLCYCGQKNVGATVAEGRFADKIECKAECETLGKTFVSCGITAEDSPMGNLLCYKTDECTKAGGSWSTTQTAECEAGQRYCYPTPKAIELQIHLGEITQVFDIGTYINAFYSYGLGAATIIAVVMIMIGGVQWMIGSSVGSVDAARKRITNASVGLILLLSAYLILKTVNPYLVQFKTIELPMMKPSLFVNGSCEDYELAGYNVAPKTSGEKACGDDGVILTNSNGVSSPGKCVYEDCPDIDSACSKHTGEYKCMTCQSYANEATNAGISASASICASLQPTQKEGSKTQLRCEYIKDVDFNNAVTDLIKTLPLAYVPLVGSWKVGEQGLDSALQLLNVKSTGMCGMLKINCGSITKCGNYEDVDIYAGDPEVDLADLDSIEGLFEKICRENPCSVDKGGKVVGSCDVRDADPILYTFGIGTLDCYDPVKEAKEDEIIEESSSGIWGAK